MLTYENKAKRKGFRFIVGIDEAGRGPLAGPVVSSAVFLKQESFTHRIDDSKKLTPLQREKAFHEIFHKANVGIGIISESVIDNINILEASYRAMELAVRHLFYRGAHDSLFKEMQDNRVFLLVDGQQFKTNLPYAYQTIIQGESKSLSIACASIVAKVARDRILRIYDQVYPQYGFGCHKGYATRGHREAVKRYGLSLIHRKSFRFHL